MSEKQVKVECHAGYKADEHPRRVEIGGEVIEVVEVEGRWYSPGDTFFRVLLDNGERYVLRHREGQDVWMIEAYRART